MSDPIRVVLTDDHLVVRRGVADVLSSSGQISIVGEAANGQEALEVCRATQPDIVIMDVRMKGMDGIETTSRIKAQCPQVRIIGLSTFPQDDIIQGMKGAGASGFLVKELTAAELIDATVRIHAGETIFFQSEEAVPGGDDDPDPVPMGETYVIGAQQQKVLWLLTKGLTNNEIAEHLKISVPTARYHVSAIFRKLDVSNRSEAVALALREGLV